MRGMYETMQRMRAAKRNPETVPGTSRADRAALQAQPESLLAALLSQVHRRDTLLTQGSNPLFTTALSGFFADGAPRPTVHACPGSDEECAAIAAGMALRYADTVRGDGARPVTIAVLEGFPPLKGVLQLVQERDLSLLLVVRGQPESRADAQRRLLGTKVPVLPVDEADAVAICRVAQETLLRARNGWGGAVIHAIPMTPVADPLVLLRQHLEKRGLVKPTT